MGSDGLGLTGSLGADWSSFTDDFRSAGFGISDFSSDLTSVSTSEDFEGSEGSEVLTSTGFESAEICELESDFISSSLGFGVLGVLGGFVGVASTTGSSKISV